MDDALNLNGLSALSSGPHQQLNQLPHFSSQRLPAPSGQQQTLPSIHGMQNQYSAYGQGGSGPNTPLTPYTPSSTGSSLQPSYSGAGSQHVSRAPASLPPLSSYGQQGSQYHASTAMMTPPTSAYTNPHMNSSTPVSGGPHIQPRPQGGMGFGSQYPHSQLPSQLHILPNQEPEPTHVVGQQGRRGVLPSAPGRPNPGTAKALVPQKDKDGKFPCPNCTKTYLHAKHLKRHMLRHTGDRPYQCKLCKDTFSRSDILKRHFQKCSLRRGVSGDTDHLEGSRAHLTKNRSSVNPSEHQASGSNAAMFGNAGLSNHLGGMPGTMHDHPNYSEGISLSARTSRSNSLLNHTPDNRRSMSSIDNIMTNRANFSNDFIPATSLGGMSNSLSGYSMPSAQAPQSAQAPMSNNYGYQPSVSGADMNQISAMKTENSYDNEWSSSSFGHGGQEDFMYPNRVESGSIHSRAESDIPPSTFASNDTPNDTVFSNLYSGTSNFNGDQLFPNWPADSDHNTDPLNHKAQEMINYCLKRDPSSEHRRSELMSILTLENIKTFLSEYRHFQCHWPIIHMPTFNPTEAHVTLLLSMASVGCVYSDTLSLSQTRAFMELVRAALYRNSRVLAVLDSQTADSWQASQSVSGPELEELQALTILQCLFNWHGNQDQRRCSREEWWKLPAVIRQLGLTETAPPNKPGYSILHQSHPEQQNLSIWRWESWVEQEKLLRTAYLVFLVDTAMVLYFNAAPQMDPSQMRLPLPSDDAPWEARTANECANALGLNGAQAQQGNTHGSRRMRQPELNRALGALMSPQYMIQPSSTNVWSKFILIHALHVQIWNSQREATLSSNPSPPGFPGYSSGTSTPLSQQDWVTTDGFSGASSIDASAENAMMQYPASHHQQLRATTQAIEKWKQCWDIDMEIQYPAAGSQYVNRRVGFCRDGIHFYWLAKSLLQHSRASQWQLSPDGRFHFVMNMLKQIKTNIAKNNKMQNIEVGSIGEIQDSYGIEDLTLDMRLLFAPISKTEETSTL